MLSPLESPANFGLTASVQQATLTTRAPRSLKKPLVVAPRNKNIGPHSDPKDSELLSRASRYLQQAELGMKRSPVIRIDDDVFAAVPLSVVKTFQAS